MTNSLVHLASAGAKKQYLTPLGGQESGPRANALWGLANLVGGSALARAAAGPGHRRGPEFRASGPGSAAVALSGVAYDRMTRAGE